MAMCNTIKPSFNLCICFIVFSLIIGVAGHVIICRNQGNVTAYSSFRKSIDRSHGSLGEHHEHICFHNTYDDNNNVCDDGGEDDSPDFRTSAYTVTSPLYGGMAYSRISLFIDEGSYNCSIGTRSIRKC